MHLQHTPGLTRLRRRCEGHPNLQSARKPALEAYGFAGTAVFFLWRRKKAYQPYWGRTPRKALLKFFFQVEKSVNVQISNASLVMHFCLVVVAGELIRPSACLPEHAFL